jgi:hypothetical protein
MTGREREEVTVNTTQGRPIRKYRGGKRRVESPVT